MEKFEVNILGCGSALPTLQHYASSQVVNICEKLFMIDCGEGTQMQLRKSRLKFSKLNHIFISHLHGDHCFGLMGLISTFGLIARTATLHVHAFADFEPILRSQLDFFCKHLPFKVEFHAIPINTVEQIYEDKSMTVTAFPVNHRIPCVGFIFREKPGLAHIRKDMMDFLNINGPVIYDIKQGAGWTTPDGKYYSHEQLTTPGDVPRTYVYCSDTKPVPENAGLFQGADMLYHEATFADCDAARASETFHSTAAQAAEMARLANVKHLVIGHFSARYLDEQILLDEAASIFPNTILAAENLCLQL